MPESGSWTGFLGVFLRILLLLLVVGLLIPQLALFLAQLASPPGLDGNPELRFQDNIQRVMGLHYISQVPVVHELEREFTLFSVELRRYYYRGEARGCDSK